MKIEVILDELVTIGYITRRQKERVEKQLNEKPGDLWETLKTTFVITREELDTILEMIADDEMSERVNQEIITTKKPRFSVPFVNLEFIAFEPVITRLVPEEMARKLLVIPLARTAGTLTVAMANPLDKEAIEEINFTTGYSVEVVYSTKEQIITMIDKIYKETFEQELFNEVTPKLEELNELKTEYERHIESMMEDDPIVSRIVNSILMESINNNYHSIHLESKDDTYVVILQKSGVLEEKLRLPFMLDRFIINRFKLMAGINYWLQPPQEGILRVKFKNKVYLFQLSVRMAGNKERLDLVAEYMNDHET